MITHIGPSFPTLIRSNTVTTPITNKYTFHTIHLTPCPTTTSDHIPIIAKITANPIQIPIKPRPHFTRADWDSNKRELNNHPIPNLTEKEPDDIDDAINGWTNQIKQASDNHIPTLRYRILPGPQPNEEITNTQRQLDEIYDHIRVNGIQQAQFDQLSRLRIRIRQQYNTNENETWNDIIKRMDMTSDLTEFWKTVKRFKGAQKQNYAISQKLKKRKESSGHRESKYFHGTSEKDILH